MLYFNSLDFYSTAQSLTSDISICTKRDMYHYKIDRTKCSHIWRWSNPIKHFLRLILLSTEYFAVLWIYSCGIVTFLRFSRNCLVRFKLSYLGTSLNDLMSGCDSASSIPVLYLTWGHQSQFVIGRVRVKDIGANLVGDDMHIVNLIQRSQISNLACDACSRKMHDKNGCLIGFLCKIKLSKSWRILPQFR